MINAFIYDLEIINCIPDKYGNIPPGYKGCHGWGDHAGMGISVVSVADFNGRLWFAVLDSEASHHTDLARRLLQDRINGATVVGFNSKLFDDKVMRAHGFNITTHYDLLDEIKLAAATVTGRAKAPKGYKYKLDAIAQANGFAKSGSGDLAPQLWQDKKYRKVIDYCIKDTQITYELLMLGLAGELIDPNTGQYLQLRELPNAS